MHAAECCWLVNQQTWQTVSKANLGGQKKLTMFKYESSSRPAQTLQSFFSKSNWLFMDGCQYLSGHVCSYLATDVKKMCDEHTNYNSLCCKIKLVLSLNMFIQRTSTIRFVFTVLWIQQLSSASIMVKHSYNLWHINVTGFTNSLPTV